MVGIITRKDLLPELLESKFEGEEDEAAAGGAPYAEGVTASYNAAGSARLGEGGAMHAASGATTGAGPMAPMPVSLSGPVNSHGILSPTGPLAVATARRGGPSQGGAF